MTKRAFGFPQRCFSLAAICTALISPAAHSTASPAAQPAAESCELHIWPTAKYGGTYFHAANGRFNGSGTTFDLVNSEVPLAADKAYRGFGPDQQMTVLADAIKRSGKFANYNIVVHEPLSQERVAILYPDLLSDTVGRGRREIASLAPCYAEMHVTFLTVFRTTLTKMLMTGFLVRYFPADPTSDATRIVYSRLQRGEERKGLDPFSFSDPALVPEERRALSDVFKFMADRFLRKKISPADGTALSAGR